MELVRVTVNVKRLVSPSLKRILTQLRCQVPELGNNNAA